MPDSIHQLTLTFAARPDTGSADALESAHVEIHDLQSKARMQTSTEATELV
jgi:hypothetical protein